MLRITPSGYSGYLVNFLAIQNKNKLRFLPPLEKSPAIHFSFYRNNEDTGCQLNVENSSLMLLYCTLKRNDDNQTSWEIGLDKFLIC